MKLICLFFLLVCVSAIGQNTGDIPIRTSGTEFDWYKTQFNTGLGNCGPAAAAMVIYWATGRDIGVTDVRTEIGDTGGEGGTSLDDLKSIVDKHEVRTAYTSLGSADDLRRMIDRDSIAILWIHTGFLSKTTGDTTTTRIGRYYEDECGHYVVVTGYSTDKRYFVVHDPIPGDWVTNSTRYPDGSMLGSNRYFPADEIWASLKVGYVVEISR